MASLFKNKRTTLERIDKFISPIYFKDVNLRSKLYPEKRPFSRISHWPAPGRVSFADAVIHLLEFQERKVDIGSSFGPTWSTHWFQIKIAVPEEWIGKEVHLLWDSGCEAMIFSETGEPLQGLTGENGHQKKVNFILTKCATQYDLQQTYFIEVACNTRFGAGDGTMISPPNPQKYFTLSVAEIALFDRIVYGLLIDLELLHDMAKHLPDTNERAYQAMYCANQMINLISSGGRDAYQQAAALSKEFFTMKNGESQHSIIAVGHCHIDCAWLWPYDETKRKCARSWATTISLMERNPEFRFACSQAQQFVWVKENYPQLYKKVKKFVANGQFIPVGGTWVEMDGNLPSGESFIRQFLYGQHFFKEEFGSYCKEFWLPDTFGYSAQLPQIMKLAGISRFLTQKLSWNLVNKFPHHNFIWEGIDGSSVLVHFPPGDSYEMTVSVEEALKTVRNLEDKGRVPVSMMLFGHGDGGGGPDEDMLERQKRLLNVDGLPKVKLGTPDEFFSCVEQRSKENLCKWVGELFLELHNGTYTSQAAMKRANRLCERQMHIVELYQSILSALDPTGFHNYPKDKINRLWKLLLLNQFHDVLPGSSIKEVHDDAQKYFDEILESRGLLFEGVAEVIEQVFPSRVHCISAFNSLSWQRTELIEVDLPLETVLKKFNIRNTDNSVQQFLKNAGVSTLIPVKVIAVGSQIIHTAEVVPAPAMLVNASENSFIIQNQYLRVCLNSAGNITSLKHLDSNREAITPQGLGNELCIYDDIPLYWDAWDVMDYHLETKKPAIIKITKPLTVIEKGPLRVILEFSAAIGERSHMTQKVIVDAVHPYVLFDTVLDWHESHKFLKVEFSVDVRAPHATYDIQFGHVQRPTHYNTSWDAAKFEVYGHRWVDLSEYDWGFALLNRSIYGHSVHDNHMRMSLLRSPKSPDDTADQGEHKFVYAAMPHKGRFQDAGVIHRAEELNCSLIYSYIEGLDSEEEKTSHESFPEPKSWFEVSSLQVILSNVKMAEKIKKCLVIRLYEAYGGHTTVTLKSSLSIACAMVCNILEEVIEDAEQLVWQDGSVELKFQPFQIMSLLLKLT